MVEFFFLQLLIPTLENPHVLDSLLVSQGGVETESLLDGARELKDVLENHSDLSLHKQSDSISSNLSTSEHLINGGEEINVLNDQLESTTIRSVTESTN